MKPELDKETDEARKMLLWLSFECPKGGNPPDCPSHVVRLKGFSERRRWVESLSNDECLAIYSCHKRCQLEKDMARKCVQRDS